MQKRIIAVAAALGMIFGSALIPAEASGEPVLTERTSETVQDVTKPGFIEPIRPKEVKSGQRHDQGDMEPAADTVSGGFERDGAGGVFAAIGNADGFEQSEGTDQCGESAELVYEKTDEDFTGQPESTDRQDGADKEYLGDWTISFYCSCSLCCGQWSGGATASGVMPSAWYTAATGDLPFGTILYVDGLGTFEVQDRGTDYGWLDVFVGDHGEALANGLQTRAVYIVR